MENVVIWSHPEIQGQLVAAPTKEIAGIMYQYIAFIKVDALAFRDTGKKFIRSRIFSGGAYDAVTRAGEGANLSYSDLNGY